MGQDAQRVRTHDKVDNVPALLRTIEDDAGKRRFALQPKVTFDDGVFKRKFAHLDRSVTARTRFKTAQHTVLRRPSAKPPEPVFGKLGGECFFEQRLRFGAVNVTSEDAQQRKEDTEEFHVVPAAHGFA